MHEYVQGGLQYGKLWSSSIRHMKPQASHTNTNSHMCTSNESESAMANWIYHTRPHYCNQGNQAPLHNHPILSSFFEGRKRGRGLGEGNDRRGEKLVCFCLFFFLCLFHPYLSVTLWQRKSHWHQYVFPVVFPSVSYLNLLTCSPLCVFNITEQTGPGVTKIRCNNTILKFPNLLESGFHRFYELAFCVVLCNNILLCDGYFPLFNYTCDFYSCMACLIVAL